MPALLSTASTARKNPISRLSGVVSVLSVHAWPALLRNTTSVNVPPISTGIAEIDIPSLQSSLRDHVSRRIEDGRPERVNALTATLSSTEVGYTFGDQKRQGRETCWHLGGPLA